MKRCNTLDQLKKEFDGMTSGWSQDTIWMAKASLFVAEMLDQRLPPKPKAKQKRPASAWNKFFAAGMRDGLTPKEIGKRWRDKQRPTGKLVLRKLA